MEWHTLEHIEVVLGILAALAAIAWTIYRADRGKALFTFVRICLVLAGMWALNHGVDAFFSSPETAQIPPPETAPAPDSTPIQTPVEMEGDFTNSLGMKFCRIPAGEFMPGMKFRLIPPGEFMMGSPEDEEDRDDNEGPVHRVRITRPFYLGMHEVTQGQWESLMGTTPWKGKGHVKEGPDYAASYVSWEDTQEFIKKLSSQEGRTYRLPTEAEWEYACRAGSSSAYHFGNDASQLGDYAWYAGNADQIGEEYAHRVGQKKPNAWGLYDMHGNVWERCSDWYAEDYYAESPTDDPSGPSSGSSRVARGGGWHDAPRHCRAADRGRDSPDYRGNYARGFRVAQVLAE